VSFVSVFLLLARVGAIWWPLSCVALFEGCVFVCVLCFSVLAACQAWGQVVAPRRPGRLIFDVFEAAGVTFWSILASFWEPEAPCSHLPSPSGALW